MRVIACGSIGPGSGTFLSGVTVRNERLATVAQLLPYHYYQVGEGLNGLVCYIDPLKELLAARYSGWLSQAPCAATASELSADGSKASPGL